MRLAHQATGFSLIELMVTTLIGLVILNGVFQIIIASKRASIDQQEISYIQENARFVLDTISRDVRMAGFIGCATAGSQPIHVTTGKPNISDYSAIAGVDHESGRQQFPAQYRAQIKDKTDALTISRGEYEQGFLVREQNPVTQVLELWSHHQFKHGQTLAVVEPSCQFNALLTATDFPAGNAIAYRTASQHCQAVVGGEHNCTHPAYPPGSRVMPLIANTYFIGESALLPGAPALKRQTIAIIDGAQQTRTEELATGIENMQLQYGIDRNGDGRIAEYRAAHQMDINADGVIDHRDWQTVRAVKIELLLVSQSPAFSEPQTVQFSGVNYTGLFMRQVVSTTITLRNT